MNDAARQRVQSLAAEIASMADDNFGAHRRDISIAAQTIIQCAEPSAADSVVPLVIRLAPYVPQGDRLELPDGRLVKGVKAIEVIDRHNEQREARIIIRGVAVLGQTELTGA
jgi:hypothetical protein